MTFILLTVSIQSADTYETDGVWELDHRFSQKISAGTTTDLYPSPPEWSPDLLIAGIQFFNHYMAVLHCETPSGSIPDHFNVFYTQRDHSGKSTIKITFENEEEIVLSLFSLDNGETVFAYCDARPQPDKVGVLLGSTHKILF